MIEYRYSKRRNFHISCNTSMIGSAGIIRFPDYCPKSR